MMNEEIKLIQRVVEEEMEVKYYDKRDDMVQFEVISLDGEAIPEGNMLIVSMEHRQLAHMMNADRYFRSTSIETDNFYGKLIAYHCQKKKGLTGKVKLKTLKTLYKTYHKEEMESGAEPKTKLKEWMASGK